MPIVPVRQSPVPEVAPQPLPGVQRLPYFSHVPPGAFGGAEVPNIGGVVDAVQQVYQKQKAEANEIAVNDADNQATALRDQVLYGTDQQPGILRQQGKNAIGSLDTSLQQWNDGIAQIHNSLSNPEQKLAFQARVAGYDHALHMQVQSHVAQQIQQTDADTTHAYVNNRINDAQASFANEAQSNQSLDMATAAIADLGRRQGRDPEWIQEQTARTLSEGRLSVLQQLLTAPDSQGGGDLRASAYLAKYQKDFVGSDLARANSWTEAGSVKGESLRQAQQILGNATTLSDAMKATDAITDPRIHDATAERIRQHFSDLAASERDARNDAFNRSSATIEQNGGNVDAIPVSDRVLMSPEQNDALSRRAEQIRNPVVHTDAATYAHLVNMAGLNTQTQRDFENLNLMQYQSKLSEADFKYLVRLQSELLRADDRHQTADQTRQMRTEERTTLTNAKAVTKAQEASQRARALVDSMNAKNPGSGQSLGQFLTPPPKLHVPQWMVDSARNDPDYMDYLKLHNVDVNSPNILVQPRAVQPAPKVPGAPISVPVTPR